MAEPTREQIEAAAKVFNDDGAGDIILPWEADQDDVDRWRYETLVKALSAALSLPNKEG